MTISTDRSQPDPSIGASLDFAGLRDRIEGRVIGPDDEGYDAARRVMTGHIDRRPAVIVRAKGVEDVRRTVATARETGLELAVRSGGHSAAGHGTTDGGIVLDLRHMTSLEIDPGAKTAWAEAGLTAVAVTQAAAEHGLAIGFGDTGSVGIGGITLGGGVGYLGRKHGLTIDNLLAADVNFVGDEGESRVRDAYPGATWGRLAEVKRRYDPTNLFRLNQNIPPA